MRTTASATTIPMTAQTRLPLKSPPRTGGGITVMFVLVVDVTIVAVDISELLMKVVTVVTFATTVDTTVVVEVASSTPPKGANRRIEARGLVEPMEV